MDIREAIRSLFTYEEMGIRRFSKDTYAPSFDKFQEIAEDFDKVLDEMYAVCRQDGTGEMEAAEEKPDCNSFCLQVAHAFVDYIKENAEPELSRGKQEEIQLNHNLFMATYVLPHIMEMRNAYYKDLTKAIEKTWGAAFKNSKIKAATFETVAGGFQRKLFGFSI